MNHLALNGLIQVKASMRMSLSMGWMACLILGVTTGGASQDTAKDENLTSEEQASKIVFRNLKLEDVSLEVAIEVLRIKCRDRDPAQRGVNLLIANPAAASKARLSLDLANVSAKDALLQIAKAVGWKVRFDPRVVVLTNATEPVAHTFKPDTTSPMMMQRAASIIRPQVQYQGASVEEAVESIRIFHFHMHWIDPGKRFVNIITRIPERIGNSESISMNLQSVSQLETLSYIAEMAGLKLRADEHALVLLEAAPARAGEPTKEIARPGENLPASASVMQRASGIILPNVQMAGATVQECVEFLRLKTAKLHTPDGDSRAVNVELKAPEGTKLPKVTLHLLDTPLIEVLRYVAELAELELRVADDSFILEAK